MRTAEDIVKDYRARGYSDERLRALANGRPEPIRSQILEILAQEDEPVIEETAELVVEDVLAQVNAEVSAEISLPDPDDSAAGAIEEEAAKEQETVMQAEETEAVEDEVDEPEIVVETMAGQEQEMVVALEETKEPETTEAETAETEDVLEIEDAQVEMIEAKKTAEEAAEPAEEAAEAVEVIEAVAEDVPVLEKETAGKDKTGANLSLAEIKVERITQDEYRQRHGEVGEVTGELIDLRGQDELQEQAAADHDGMGMVEAEAVEVEAVEIKADPGGPVADDGANTPAAGIQDDIFAKIDSEVFVVFQKDSEQTVESIKDNRAAIRSLKVLQEALREDPELADVAKEETRIIDLNPPYAVAPEAQEPDVMAAGPAENMEVRKDESGLIHFPSEMIASYKAIAMSQQLNIAKPAPGRAEDIQEINLEEDDRMVAAEGSGNRFPIIIPAETTDTMPDDTAKEIEDEISVLRNWLTELEDALKLKKIENDELTRLIAERDETLQVQAEELQQLRENLHVDEARMLEIQEVDEKLRAARDELATVRKEMAALEREYNILSTSTVPDLVKDKEDLIQLLEEETAKQQPLATALHESGRRVAIGYTLAAAAGVLLVLSLVLQWVQGDSERIKHKSMLAEIRNDLAHEKERGEALYARAKLIETKWSKKYQALRREKARLVMDIAKKDQVIAAQEKKLEMALLQGPSVEQPRSLEDVVRDNRALGDGRSRVSYGNNPPQHNGVRGLDEWRKRRQAQQQAAGIKTKFGSVRSGEGISHVLWREIGVSNPALVEWVARKNGLKKNSSQGYWIIHPGDRLIIPANPSDVAKASGLQDRATD